ncbi:hypothetical protein FALCPG4_005229 [Fusarium falciforme]
MAQPPGATVLLHCTAPATIVCNISPPGWRTGALAHAQDHGATQQRKSTIFAGWRRWLVKGKDGIGIRLAHVAKHTLKPSDLGVDSNYACFASYEAKSTRVSGAVYLPAA